MVPLLHMMIEHIVVGLTHVRNHLGPDGRFAPENTSVEMKRKLFFVSSHNILAEELFEQLDQWLTSRTNNRPSLRR